MKLFYFTGLMHQAFKNHPWAKLVSIHQSNKGWAMVIKDQTDGQEYVMTAYPVKSEKAVTPDTIDQLLKMNKI